MIRNSLKKIKSSDLAQRLKNANSRNFKLILFSLIVGLLVGALSSLFRYVLEILERMRNTVFANFGKYGFWSYVLPFVIGIGGILVSLYLVKKYAPETSGSGVQEIEGALDEVRPLRWNRVLPVKFFASLFSLGSGFLLGREGPTIQLGANVGKMIKDFFRQPDEENNTLVSAGAAAGLASAFNAPFSGIIFVVEEMHGHFKYTFFSLASIMVAAGTADLVVRAAVGNSPVIKMMIYPSPSIKTIGLFILLGLVFSIVGYIFNKLLIVSLDFFSSLKKSVFLISVIIVGLIIAVVGVSNPDMIGGGYGTIRMVLDHSFSLQFLLVLFIGRLLLTVLGYGTGVPGGIFAPLLSIGVVVGLFFGTSMHSYFPELVSHPGIFAVAGMAGIFASTVRAPLTGLMLALEMTSNFELILPLIFTTLTAAVTTAMIGNEPIYTTLLKRTLAKSAIK
jgi:CIC family chloride channel protein